VLEKALQQRPASPTSESYYYEQRWLLEELKLVDWRNVHLSALEQKQKTNPEKLLLEKV